MAGGPAAGDVIGAGAGSADGDGGGGGAPVTPPIGPLLKKPGVSRPVNEVWLGRVSRLAGATRGGGSGCSGRAGGCEGSAFGSGPTRNGA